MKYSQLRPGIELWSPILFPTTMNIVPNASLSMFLYSTVISKKSKKDCQFVQLLKSSTVYIHALKVCLKILCKYKSTGSSVIWKSDLTDKMKRSFFQAAIGSILLYGCTRLTLTKRLEKKLDGNYTRMLRAILNRSWRQHPTKQQLYGHLLAITKTIEIRRTRHAGHG